LKGSFIKDRRSTGGEILCHLLAVKDKYDTMIVGPHDIWKLELEMQQWPPKSLLRTNARYLTIRSAVVEMRLYPANSKTNDTNNWTFTFPEGLSADSHYELELDHKSVIQSTYEDCMGVNSNNPMAVKGVLLDTFSPSALFDQPVLIVHGTNVMERMEFIYMSPEKIANAQPRLETINLG
jgi:hypothetical protein